MCSSFDAYVKGITDVGGLVGNNYGSSAVIESSYATGEVQGEMRVGGLAGNNRYEINNSYATGKVIGSDRNIGGLVGNNRDGAKIYNSHATGDVEGGNNVGGLVGIATHGTVENCYAIGDVSGTYRIGGLIGFTNGSGIHQRSYIINCFALGDVAGDERVGGLVGEVYSNSSITESYALNQKLIRDNTDDTSFGRIFGERHADSINDNYANKDMTEPFEGAFNNKTPGSKDGGDLTSFSVDNGVLTVERTGSIAGTITDNDSNPIEGKIVSLTIDDVTFQTTTDTDGTYTMWNITAGTNITVTANMDGYQPSSTEVTVEAGQQNGDVDFTLLDN